MTIPYHPCKANVVVDALSQKVKSMGTLSIMERPLALDVQSLANKMVRMDLSNLERILAFVGAYSSLFD